MSGVRRRHWKPVKRVNPSGKTVWKARHPWGHAGTFKRERDAQAAIDAAYVENERGVTAEDFGTYAASWTMRHPRSERTNESSDGRLAQVLDVEVDGRKLREWPFRDLRRRHALDLIDHMLRVQGRSPGGAQGILRTLSAMAEDAITDEVAEINPFARVRVRSNDPRASKRRREARVWSFEQMHKFATAAGPGEPAVRMLADCGLRVGELLGLRRDLQDLRAGVFRVRGTAWRGQLLEGSDNKNHDREGPIPPGCLVLLRAMPVRIDSPWLFPSPGGGTQNHPGGLLYRYENWRRDVWLPAQEASGMDPTPHEFRHSWVSHLRAAGVDPADLAEIAGHSLEVATAHYTHALGRSFDRVREVVG